MLSNCLTILNYFAKVAAAPCALILKKKKSAIHEYINRVYIRVL